MAVKKVLLIVVMIFISVILFVETGQSENIKTAFGEWHVELSTTDKDGNTKPMSMVRSIGGQLLSWTVDGQDITSITCTVYAVATGSGYDFCDIDLSATDIRTYLDLGNDDYTGPAYSGPSNIVSIPLNAEPIEVMSATTTLSEFEVWNRVNDGASGTFSFLVFSPPVKYRGRTDTITDPWAESQSTFTIDTTIEVGFVGDETSSCNEPYPGTNCFTSPSTCGSCSSTFGIVSPNKGTGISELFWEYPHFRYKYHHDGGWSSWATVNSGSPLQVFYHHNIIGLYGKASVAGTFRGLALMYSPTGQYITLNSYKEFSNSNLDEHVEVGEECFAYFSTGWSSNHKLKENGVWNLEGNIWVESGTTPTPQTYDLTINSYPCSDAIIHVVGMGFDQEKQSANHVAIFPNLDAGYYDISALCTGCYPKSSSITLQTDSTVTITMNPLPNLSIFSNGLFSISSEVAYQNYEYNGNYLGSGK